MGNLHLRIASFFFILLVASSCVSRSRALTCKVEVDCKTWLCIDGVPKCINGVCKCVPTCCPETDSSTTTAPAGQL
ncbi:hypothetical protein LINGRAHAP2_LOCUS240 [Linum grandiflorum]